MQDSIKTIEYRDHKIHIMYDVDGADEYDHPNSYGNGCWEDGPDAESPNEKPWEWVSIWHRNNDKVSAGFDSPEDFVEYFSETHDIFTVRHYTHGGTAFSISSSGQFGCRFDSGFAGMVAISKTPPTEEKDTTKLAVNCCNHLEAWWNGYVQGYVIEGPDDDSCDDSCWGFLIIDHDDSYMIDQAKSVIDYHLARKLNDHISSLKSKIKGKCPLNHRTPAPIV